MDLHEFVGFVGGFDTPGHTHTEKIKLLGWYHHTHRGLDRFDFAAIRGYYRELHIDPPDLSTYAGRMVSRRPAELLKDRGGYRLAGDIRRALDSKYGQVQSSVAIGKLLADLPARVPEVAEREFLREALACYKAKAFRAAIVMVWNLTYDHLVHWIVADPTRLADFNNAITRRFPKKSFVIGKLEDFEELKESETIEVCSTAGLISNGITKILREKLGRRNSAAHPSAVEFSQYSAEEAISDLVQNVVLKLS